MKTLRCTAAIMAGLSLAGCAHTHWGHHHQEKAATEPATTQFTATASTAPALADQPATPEMLQAKAQAYAQSLQQMMSTTQQAQTPAAPEPSPPAAPTPAPVTQPAPILEPEPAPPPPAVDVSVGAAPPTTQSSDSGMSLNTPLTQRIDEQAHDQPHDPAAQLNQQLLAFVRGQSVPDETALAGLASGDRDVLSAILDGLSNYRDILRSDPTATTTKKLQPLLDMSDRLHAAADLNIPAIALCSAVTGFGDYTTIDADNLPTGQITRALVYCQVTNFASQLTGSMWVTKLNERLNLYSEATGKSVWSKPAVPIVDSCKQRRHDCYCVNLIELPAGLPAGKYILTATLEDQISNKLTQATLPVTFK